jgi:hypothetical protein
MDKRPQVMVSIFAVVLFILGSSTPVLANEEKPDLIFTGISYHTIIADLPCLFCIVKNNGTATASDFMIVAFGGLLLLNEKVIYNDEGLAPGDSVEEILFLTGPFFGIYRLNLYISTTTPEENTSNNHFTPNFFIICCYRLNIWVFRELPF